MQEFKVGRYIVICKTALRHIIPLFQSLHWLPIPQRIQCKINTLFCKCITRTAPSYPCDCLQLYTPSRTLCYSSDTDSVHIPVTVFNFTHPPVLSAILLILTASIFLLTGSAGSRAFFCIWAFFFFFFFSFFFFFFGMTLPFLSNRINLQFKPQDMLFSSVLLSSSTSILCLLSK